MKAKLIVEDKEFEIDINHPELEKLIKSEKKTGYERIENTNFYYSISGDDIVTDRREMNSILDKQLYDISNYYSDKTVAENNARADKLMRQLRRFAVEHREKEIDWNNLFAKWTIYYRYDNNKLEVYSDTHVRPFGCLYFNSEETAKLAIKTFHDELIWYFTEYKDSL